MNKIIEFAKEQLVNVTDQHDFFHAQRVAQMAIKIYRHEVKVVHQHDEDMLLAMGYLHDTLAHHQEENEAFIETVQALLAEENFTPGESSEIIRVMKHFAKFRNSLHKEAPLSFLGRCINDADLLDALGAIGIARIFSYGAKHDQPLYNPENRNNSVQYFYNKLLQLDQYMSTLTGTKVARQRIEFMRTYLVQFWADWEVDLPDSLK